MPPAVQRMVHPAATVAAALLGAVVTSLARPANTHWAYQPIASHLPDIPTPGWIDAQLDAMALAQGVEPAGPADPSTLCRRLHLVLTGLPPTPEQLERFLTHPEPTRVESTVDALLASPAFGEHWGRHWLDVVRYADSVTLRGFVFREAWRYRDYVVDAFNADMPFAHFVREQIAGDLLPAPSLADARRNRIATTFWAMGDANLEEQDKRQLEWDVIDEQLEVMGKAFLAQTLSCARCHDHKFDPIPTRDYHALAGILSGTRLLRHANVSEWLETPLPLEPGEEAHCKAAEERLARLEADLKSAKNSSAASTRPETGPPQPASLPAAEPSRLRALEKAVAEARVAARRPHAMAPVEVGATNVPVLRRGSWRNPGEVVPRGMLKAAFRATAPEPSGASSGRVELAEWLVARDQPLSWRVQVNRAWHWTFGRGLVASVDNLGTTGDLPTHPALLDALAAGFRNGGGSMKRLVRALVLTRTFQRASSMADPVVARSRAVDPANRWLGRFHARPVEAEVLRDSMWVAGAGLLHDGRGEAPFPAGIAADYGHGLDRPVRSLYLPQFRNARPEFVVAFDGADPCRATGAREASTVATQALFVLNNPWVREQAARVAAVVATDEDAVGALWRRILARGPSAGERRGAEEHLSGTTQRAEALADLAHALFASLDFRRIP